MTVVPTESRLQHARDDVSPNRRSGAGVGRRHLCVPAIALLALGLALIMMWAGSGGPGGGGGNRQPGRVYALGEVVAGLQRRPSAWVGEATWVRAIAWPCPGWATGPCLARTPVLVDPGAGGPSAVLALAVQPASPLLALTRSFPLMGAFLPAQAAPLWGRPATYRMRIVPVPAPACAVDPCYEALLLERR